MQTHWYNVLFTKGTSLRSYMIPAACLGNAISVGWSRIENTEGTRDGWSLSMTSNIN
jgi:hypothetical protein